MPRGEPNPQSRTFRARLLQAPINVIRYLQNKIVVLQQEREVFMRENQRLATELRIAAMNSAIQPPPDQQMLIAMNKNLMEENQRLTTVLYNTNQAISHKTRDMNLLWQGRVSQMEENINLKALVESQKNEISRLKLRNGGRQSQELLPGQPSNVRMNRVQGAECAKEGRIEWFMGLMGKPAV